MERRARVRLVTPPPDKALTHRALFLSAVAEGASVIVNPSRCLDVAATVSCLRRLGVRIRFSDGVVAVEGRGLRGLRRPRAALDAGQSGTTMRLLAGLLAAQDFDSRLTCRGSLLARPMDRVAAPLRLMGADIRLRGGRAPLSIRGRALAGARLRLETPSAQVKSALLLAGLYATGKTVVSERWGTRDHTERLLRHFAARIRTAGRTTVLRPGPLAARRVLIPGDISSAAPFIAAACLREGSRLTLKDVGLNPGRLGLVRALRRMGADIIVRIRRRNPEPVGSLFVRSSRLRGVRVGASEVPSMIDELPLLVLLASQAHGTSVIHGVSELRHKESDRIESLRALFRSLGLRLEARGDRLRVRGPQIIVGGKTVEVFNDHRIAMAAAVAGSLSQRAVRIGDAVCVRKSYPGFFSDFQAAFSQLS